jgi:hypothetical protein
MEIKIPFDKSLIEVRHIYLTAILIFGWNYFSSCGWYLEHDSEVATHVCVRQFDFKISFHFVELNYQTSWPRPTDSTLLIRIENKIHNFDLKNRHLTFSIQFCWRSNS